MGFKLNGSTITTADGKEIGRYAGRKASLALSVEGDPADVLAFITAAGAAYEAIHPPVVQMDVELDEAGDTEWPAARQELNERTVKAGGKNIRVHMTDVDPWPSDLHGHVIGQASTKVDAYDGGIYNTTTRQRVGTMGKKDLARLQDGLRKDTWARDKLDARVAAPAPERR